LETGAHLHQREAKEIEASPISGFFSVWVARGHADAPNVVEGAGFDQNAVTRL
jgi:hypothetical protein